MQRADAVHETGAAWRKGIGWAMVQLVAFLLFLWLLVTAEFCSLTRTHFVHGNWWALLAVAWVNTATGWLVTGPVLLVPYLAIFAFSAGLSRWLLRFFLLVLLLIQLALTAYFSATSVPLGADLYGYSWNDIRETLGAAGVPRGPLAAMVLVPVACAAWLNVAGRWGDKYGTGVGRPWIAGLAGVLATTLLSAGWPGMSYGASEFSRNLVLDKTVFFLRNSWIYWHPRPAETDIYADNYAGGDGAPGLRQRRYIDRDNHPFLTADTVADVLSPFFRRDDRPPNIVILLVEGLGRAFANGEAYLGNFTPFLDSLSRQSLYWDNFLSAGGRTFAALPSVLGSLPFAENGFLALGDWMPPVLTLPGILQANGYRTCFYYGGDAGFDNMAAFLHREGIGSLQDAASFPAGYSKLPAENGFSWGYGDGELFRRWLQTAPVSPAPGLSVLLTLSMHSPFRLNEPEVWRERFEKRMDELGFDEAKKKEYRLSGDQYASILYTDDALRVFMAACSHRPDFAHTIFLITGDHRMPEIPMRDKIDRFHVPLVIYSPLLRRTAVFHSVSTHLDITPTLLAWLQHTYGLAVPAVNAWVGDGLDTAEGFRNIHRCPLMQTKTDIVDFVAGEDHLNGGTVFRLHSDLSENEISDDSVKAALQEGFDQYRRRNLRWLKTRRSWPDSVLRRFGR